MLLALASRRADEPPEVRTSVFKGVSIGGKRAPR
jgi:hypothetical protein